MAVTSEDAEEEPRQRRRRPGLGLPPPVGGASTDQHLLQQFSRQDEDDAKMKVMEARLAEIEGKTSSQLYNIEALLRNAVFQRGTSTRAGPAAFMRARDVDRKY